MWKTTSAWLRKKSADTELTALKERYFILTSNCPSVQKSTVLAGKYWFKKTQARKIPSKQREPPHQFLLTHPLPLTIQPTVQHLESFTSLYK